MQKEKPFRILALKAFCIEVTTFFFFKNTLSLASKSPNQSHAGVQKLLYILLFLDESLLSATKLGLEGIWMTVTCGSFKTEIFNIKF